MVIDAKIQGSHRRAQMTFLSEGICKLLNNWAMVAGRKFAEQSGKHDWAVLLSTCTVLFADDHQSCRYNSFIDMSFHLTYPVVYKGLMRP